MVASSILGRGRAHLFGAVQHGLNQRSDLQNWSFFLTGAWSAAVWSEEYEILVVAVGLQQNFHLVPGEATVRRESSDPKEQWRWKVDPKTIKR